MASVIPMVMGASGNPERMQPGDAAALGSGGTGATTAMAALQNLGSAWQKIAENTYSSASTAPIISLSGYRMIRGRGRFVPATNNVDIACRFSTNNGSSYDSTANRYRWRYIYAAEGLTGTFETSTSNTQFLLSSSVSSTNGCAFEFNFFDFNQARSCWVSWLFNGQRQGTTNSQFTGGGGWFDLTTARDAFQFYFSSGNISVGHMLVEGLV